MLSSKETFLSLVKLGIGNANTALIPENVDWKELEALAAKQGLSAVLIDGIEKLPEPKRPPKAILLQWIGEILHGYEYRYDAYKKAIAEMAGFYNQHGLKMMVLKGFACSQNWPKPNHRPCGDIDIWQFGKQKEADALLSKEKGIEIDKSHHHHTVFNWRSFVVENHYDFIDVHHRKSSPKLETILKDLGTDDTYFITVYDEEVYLPSTNLHALFLLRHSMEHFAAAELTIRQLLDWAFFVKKNHNEIDWTWLTGILETFGMLPAYNIFNAICVEDLGFESSFFHQVQFSPSLKDRVLNDILSPEFSEKQPELFISRVLFKFRRWRANGWKHRLCYNESLWSAFWSGVWAKLLKPASI